MNSWRLGGLTAAGLVTGVFITRIGTAGGTGTAVWDALRASGFAAYLLLWLSTVCGLALHMKLRPPWLRQAVLLEVHRMSGVLAGGFLAGHLAGVLVDSSIAFGFTDLAVGFTAPYRPLALGLGAAAMWMVVAVLASTAFAAEIPQALWRRLHFLAFPAYLAALLHGLTAGTDTGGPFALLVYAATAGVVAALTVTRFPRQGRRVPAQVGRNERPARRLPGEPRWQ